MAYRITPQGTTGMSPAEMLLGKRSRTRLDLLKPHTADRVEANQLKQKEYHDSRAKDLKFDVNQGVFVQNHGQGARWLPAWGY